MTFLLVANFKSHKTTSGVVSWLSTVAPTVASAKNIEVVVAPSFPHLALLSPLTFNLAPIQLAAQDCSPFPPGSYTGAVSATQLKDLGVTYAIVGHSERRQYFHETSVEVANKIKELIDQGITPIVCLREADVSPQRGALEDSMVAKCIFCFEPEGSIGGTEIADNSEIKKVFDSIKQKYSKTAVMYGGSVNADNIKDLMGLDLSGVLVAGASQDPQDFIALVRELKHVI